VSRATIDRWIRQGYLHRVYPGVYAVGHRALAVEGRLAAALLYAGPGAALSHATGAWWREIWGSEPRRLHVTTPRRRASIGDLVLHARGKVQREWHKQLPVVPVERILLDLAVSLSLDELRWVLAEAEFRGLLNEDALEAILRRGRRGAAALRRAVTMHFPELAKTRSHLERLFLVLCERFEIEIPEVNVWAEGFRVDALWRNHMVVVELDGGPGHATPARMEKDRGRDLALRAAGYLVLRYTWRQVTRQPSLVARDLSEALAGRVDLSCPDTS